MSRLSGYDLFLFEGGDAVRFFTGIDVDPEEAMKTITPPQNVAPVR